MTGQLTLEEAETMLREQFVGEQYTKNGKRPNTGNDIEVINVRVRNGEPELKVVPIDSHGQKVTLNKHWVHAQDFKRRYINE